MFHSLNYLGFVGLDFFFVLSAFLITWTLLSEAEEKKSIHFGKYFLRRGLRIWPLYFLVVGMGFGGKLVLDNYGLASEELPNILYFLSFTLNFQIIGEGTDFLFFMVFLWSISVEEQFYIFWGLIMKYVREHLLEIAIGIILFSLFFRWYFLDLPDTLMYHTVSLLGNFGVGAIIAWIAFTKHDWFENLLSLRRSTWYLIYVLLVLNLVAYHRLYDTSIGIIFERLFLSILFGLVIFEQCFSKDRLFNLGKWKPVNYLGKISYGLYMFHGIVITLVLKSQYWFGDPEGELTLCIWRPLTVLVLTIGLAALSYEFFEKNFLKLKSKL